MKTLNQIGILYKNGYRCIKTEDQKDKMTVYLKNFETESSEEISIVDENEINSVKNFLKDKTIL